MSVLDDPRLKGFRKGYEAGRIDAIEECARVADAYGNINLKGVGHDIAAAIRALKDKP